MAARHFPVIREWLLTISTQMQELQKAATYSEKTPTANKP